MVKFLSLPLFYLRGGEVSCIRAHGNGCTYIDKNEIIFIDEVDKCPALSEILLLVLHSEYSPLAWGRVQLCMSHQTEPLQSADKPASPSPRTSHVVVPCEG